MVLIGLIRRRDVGGVGRTPLWVGHWTGGTSFREDLLCCEYLPLEAQTMAT